ncbi:MAG: carbohydrate kinase family protein [Planctomycetaceae bacterium]|nr:carbohydrate kinase family protein [Planctomycetaceae bacterium]
MTDVRCDCLCAGIIVADHVCEPVVRLPRPGELVTTPRIDLTTGGNATNVALDLARLGRRVELVGTVGKDIFGDFVEQTLNEAGVSCRFLGRSETQATAGTLVINCQGEDRRFIHAIGANADFTGKELTPEIIGQARILYLGGFCLCDELTPENVATVFQEARRVGVTTVLDVVLANAETAWERLLPVLPYTDVFMPNTDEAIAITGLNDPLSQAERFREAGARTVVVTCGEAGAVLSSENTCLQAGTYPIDYIDGTGSGDAFSSGFIHGVLAERDLETCLRWGSALGASAVRTAGASTGVFTSDELIAFCESQMLSIELIGK